MKTSRVELIGRYSNPYEQGERLRDLTEMVPKGSPEASASPRKQVHRRLRPAEIEKLVAGYRAGATLCELADRFRLHRATVSSLLERQPILWRTLRAGVAHPAPGDRAEVIGEEHDDGRPPATAEFAGHGWSLSSHYGAFGSSRQMWLTKIGHQRRRRRCRWVDIGVLSGLASAASSDKTGMSHSARASSYKAMGPAAQTANLDSQQQADRSF